MKRLGLFLTFIFACPALMAQNGTLNGIILDELTRLPLVNATVQVEHTQLKSKTDSAGRFQLKDIPGGIKHLTVSHLSYITKTIILDSLGGYHEISLSPRSKDLNEVVVTGTMKEVNRLESAVAVEVYSPAFFKKNPTPSIFEALQNVNGVRPQVNCNVCNTGDIHINGLEGPYTLVMIDGMPIVSNLSTVYGLSGIPNSLVERIEIVKGPASSLYGSEAIGGLVNIITKNPEKAPLASADLHGTSWGEINTDLGFKFRVKDHSVLTGINYFNYTSPADRNGDNFTDVTQQNRISLFQKWAVSRKEERVMTIAGRFFYEDRWGGEMNWTPAFRGGDSRYGESIYTRRWELIGKYQLPVKEKLFFSFSYNSHKQNSVYGQVPFLADQQIAFAQLTWDKKAGIHDLLTGFALRYSYFDDNTPATANRPDKNTLPGIFVQDEMTLSTDHKLLLGLRYDYHQTHGNIITPRLAYKWTLNPLNIIRLNAGTGFRVVNLFTEDHAALTGARKVVIKGELNPERSYNVNLNYVRHMYGANGFHAGIDVSAFYTHFNNRIISDYDTNPNEINYSNLMGYAVTRGMSANIDLEFSKRLKMMLGGTLQSVYSRAGKDAPVVKQILTENWMGVWALTYSVPGKFSIDYTGNMYGPMRLPLISATDPRRAYSPVWSLQNIQLTYSGMKKFEIYGGVKNLLNWTPNRNNPFIIARTNDPFDRNVVFDPNGQAVATPDNPYALTFDPNYVYAPNQGIRFFLGLRMTVK